MFDVYATAGERRIGEVWYTVRADASSRLQILRLFLGGDLGVGAFSGATARHLLAAGLLRGLEMGIASDRRIDRDRHLHFVAVSRDFWIGEVAHAVRSHARRVGDSLAA